MKLRREITDPDEVDNNDIILDGVEYTPGKAWDEQLDYWMRDGFSRVEPLYSSEPLADIHKLEQKLQELLDRRGFVTVDSFRVSTGLTYHSARKLLNGWTEGENPKLLKTRQGSAYIYTQI